jgi:flagellar biosynthetic protein FliO
MNPFFSLLIKSSFYAKSLLFCALIFYPTLSTAASNESPPSATEKNKPDVNEPLFPIDTTKIDKQNDRFMSELINMVTTLGLIIAALLLVAWFLKKFMNTRIEQMNVSSVIKIVERRTLSPKSSLYLVEVKDNSYLIAESQNGVNSVIELHSALTPENSKPPSGFRELL